MWYVLHASTPGWTLEETREFFYSWGTTWSSKFDSWDDAIELMSYHLNAGRDWHYFIVKMEK